MLKCNGDTKLYLNIKVYRCKDYKFRKAYSLNYS